MKRKVAKPKRPGALAGPLLLRLASMDYKLRRIEEAVVGVNDRADQALRLCAEYEHEVEDLKRDLGVAREQVRMLTRVRVTCAICAGTGRKITDAGPSHCYGCDGKGKA